MRYLIFRQSEHLENYVSNELIRVVRSEYEAQKLKTDNISNNDIVIIFLLIMIYILTKKFCVQNFHDSEAVEIDAIHNRIRRVCDKHIVTGKGILSIYT